MNEKFIKQKAKSLHEHLIMCKSILEKQEIMDLIESEFRIIYNNAQIDYETRK